MLEAVLAASESTLLVVDAGGFIVQVAATEDRSAWLGTGLADWLHATGHESLQRHLERAVRQREASWFEARALPELAAVEWYRIALRPLEDGRALAVLQSIDRERRVRIESQRFRAILDQTEEAIFVVDPRSARFVEVNPTACTMLRYTREEILALGPQDIELDFPLHTREQWADFMIEVMAVGSLPYEGVHRRKDGSTYPVETLWSIKTFEGDEYLLGVGRDVTEQRRIELELRQAEESMRVSDRLTTVGTLAAGIVHEINNPLAYVMGNLEFLIEQVEEWSEGVADEYRSELLPALREARSGAVRMDRIVRDLRTFSRRDEDSVSAVSLSQVLDSSINIAMNEIRQRAKIERSYAQDVAVQANESRLGQVFLNLLINAAQAIPRGNSQQHCITVRTECPGEGRVAVEISDTGAGMSPQVLERIFDPFFTTKPVGVGTGLGLSICRSIVESMGGRIDVRSVLGEGTCFRIELSGTTAAVAVSDEAERAPRARGGGRVLIIDEDELAARALSRCLQPHRCVIEGDGQRGLARVLLDHFDAIFCELRLPDFSGLDLYRAVADERPQLLPKLVLIHGGPLDPECEAFLSERELACITKPFDAQLARQCVEQRLADDD
ncbi:PAS/PAC sensor hybrid histidine kinase [Haliangium ochraceum DSM 14365]|uniref:histidine kinase n=2 Tax=Haliangium ochraceum TaxID=80816 RepID=D0LW86_HALO1|nr:PAS/PAC sensor hybrid histidine kinase [Haliangium ochraceum DSM 14365]